MYKTDEETTLVNTDNIPSTEQFQKSVVAVKDGMDDIELYLRFLRKYKTTAYGEKPSIGSLQSVRQDLYHVSDVIGRMTTELQYIIQKMENM